MLLRENFQCLIRMKKSQTLHFVRKKMLSLTLETFLKKCVFFCVTFLKKESKTIKYLKTKKCIDKHKVEKGTNQFYEQIMTI